MNVVASRVIKSDRGRGTWNPGKDHSGRKEGNEGEGYQEGSGISLYELRHDLIDSPASFRILL